MNYSYFIYLLFGVVICLAFEVKDNMNDIKLIQTEITQLKQTCSVYEPAPILTTEGE